MKPTALNRKEGIAGVFAVILTANVALAAQQNHPVMHLSLEQREQIQAAHRAAPQITVEKSMAVYPSSVNLLSHLPYIPGERDQGYCGDCWQWSGTGVMEIAHDVQNGVHDRLSVQFINSCNPRMQCCAGGWLTDLATFYSNERLAVPWANYNAAFTSGSSGDCSSTPCGSIDTSSHYQITSISAVTIQTHNVGQAQAIANIKSVLNQNKAVWFGFFLPTQVDWDVFDYFWDYQTENVVWSADNFDCSAYPDSGQAGHAVLCVGYNEDDPNNPYWIMVNSWGTAGETRPNGIFLVSMNLDYDCADAAGNSSLFFETLNVQFVSNTPPATGSLEVTLNPPQAVSAGAQWNVDGGAWQNSGLTVSGLSLGMHTVTYKAVAGWNTPAAQSVGVSANMTAMANATYGGALIGGCYNGLFYESARIRHESSGAFSIMITPKGRFTGSLQAAGVRYVMNGMLDSNGNGQVLVMRPNMSSLTVTLKVDLSRNQQSIAGSVTDGSWIANLSGDRAIYDGKANLAPEAGQYTLVIPGQNDQATPTGYGYATIIVDQAGKVHFTGTLADGTKVTQSAQVSGNGQVPLYITLYRGAGSLISWLTFSSTSNADIEGALSWTRPMGSMKGYPAGFVLQNVATGSRYTPPAPGTPILNLANAQMVLSGGDLSQIITDQILLSPNNHVMDLGPDRLSMTFTTASGLFKGTIRNPVTGHVVAFSGVALQKGNMACGNFIENNQSGQVMVSQP